MPTFDLRQHIRSILAETAEENLDALAELVFVQTPRNQVRTAYRQALTDMVRHELAQAPRPGQRPDDAQTSTAGTGAATGSDQSQFDNQRGNVAPGGGNLRNSRTAMFRRARFRINVWVGDRTFRHILDCTIENLAFAAEESHRQAEANAAAAARYRRLVKVMEARNVITVAELTDDEIEEALRDE